MKVVLGSSSKDRRSIMSKISIDHECVSPNIDEKSIRSNDSRELVELISRAKLRKVFDVVNEDAYIICGDQVCEFNGAIKEKPEDESEAREFLRSYSGGVMKKLNGIAVGNTKTGEIVFGLDEVDVVFKNYGVGVIDEIIASGRVLHVSGGVYYDASINELYIDSISKSIDSMYGLPLDLTRELLRKVGFGT